MIEVKSSAFEQGGQIPRKFTGEGEDVSPELVFSGIPDTARELALICDDPDAPTPQPFVHWVLVGLPPSTTKLNEGDSGGGTAGKNDFSKIGYGGPMPPPGHGVHHYHFKLYALDKELGLGEGLTKDEALDAMKGHVVGEGELVGTYERK